MCGRFISWRAPGAFQTLAARCGAFSGTPLFGFLLLFLLACSLPGRGQIEPSEKGFEKARRQMVSQQLQTRNIRNPRVLEAMGQVPRHLFVPESQRSLAYDDHPLPIGEGQTISQPYIVALMTQVADPSAGDRALEVGTGSGYQAAVLAGLLQEVYTIEIVPSLAQRAGRLLKTLGYDNVHVREGDGYQGWPEKAPFEVILVTAAADRIPQPLLDQLAEGGRLVMPVGKIQGIQTLTLITKRNGQLDKKRVTAVRFVPMTGRVQKP
ncbi:MAG: protein-L-isoaspartate(D-aspartate) O-methyltransferase [Acidobacteriota bacterium]